MVDLRKQASEIVRTPSEAPLQASEPRPTRPPRPTRAPA